MMFAALLTGQNAKHAFQIWKRDRYNHASPNSAQTESVAAGALDILLAGDAWYFGKLVKSRRLERICGRWKQQILCGLTG